jgi:hypothetical protein
MRMVQPAQVPAPTPIPLTHRKGSGAAGEIHPAPPEISEPPRRDVDVGMEPTVQVKLDATGMPLPAPLQPVAAAPVTVLNAPRATPIQLRTRADHAARSELDNTPPPVRSRPPSGPHAKLERTPPPRAARPSAGQPVLRPVSGHHHVAKPTTGPHAVAKPPSGQHATTKPPSGPHLTTNAFDEVEADFFAREADLYKREAVETFDDLDHPLGTRPNKPRSRKR